MDSGNWTTQVRKGLLELCIMTLLGKGELYAYDLVKRLARIEGLVVTEGTVYPLRSRLRRGGLLKSRLVESSSGPARKYYSLTAKGLKSKRVMQSYWRELVQGVDIIMESEDDND